MRIAVCDDNKITAAYIEDYISSLPLKDISYEIFSSGEDLVHYLEVGNLHFNIYFMDIEMPGRNGIETSYYLRNRYKNALIIFMTEHKNYVYDVFEVLPFRFLLKPIEQEQFNKVFDEAIEHIRKIKQIFFFKQGKAQMQFAFDEIIYFEGNRRKVSLVTTQGEYEYYDKISTVSQKVDSNLFLQIHTSYIVNMEQIRLITESEVSLKNGVKLPISKKFRDSVRTRHMEYMEWRCGN